MAATFAAAATELSGLAGALLGWTPDLFWGATPAELSAVLEALVENDCAAASAEDLARLRGMFPDG